MEKKSPIAGTVIITRDLTRSLEPKGRDRNTDDERRAPRGLILNAATLMQELGVDDVYDTHALLRLVDALDQEPVDLVEDMTIAATQPSSVA